jgi:hypothetical protein
MLASERFTAEGAITKFRFVKIGSTNSQVIQASTVTDRIIGVYLGPADAVNADEVEVCLLGRCQVETSGSIGRGTPVTTNSSGQAVTAETVTPGKLVRECGYLLQSAASTVVDMFFVPAHYTGAIATGTGTLNFPSIAAGAIEVLTVTVTGAATGDTVILGPPSTIEAGLTWSGFVSATNTVTVRVHNTTASPIDPASASWRASVMRGT